MRVWTEDHLHRGAAFAGELTDNETILTRGLMAGTRVASNLGWRAVEALSPGDKVLTFDHAMQRLIEVRREQRWVDPGYLPRQHWPLRVPEGVLANRVAIDLLPDQPVMIETDAARDAFGDPYAVVRARSLDGVNGIAPTAPSGRIEVITLVFAQDEIIYAEGGMLALCPRVETVLSAMVEGAAADYDVLSPHEAKAVVAGLVVDGPGGRTAAQGVA